MSEFTAQQTQAIAGRGNLLVVAGAGTGKTHTLVSRCLRLVAEEGASLENILMVTFTEAAAAEMRARLRQELLKLLDARPDDERLPQQHNLLLHMQQKVAAARPEDDRLAQQLALLDAARICTLHSFCLQLVREHFHELGLDPQFSVLDEQQTRPLQREALDELLEKHYAGVNGESRAVLELIRSVGRGADSSVRKLILKLHAYSQSLPDPAHWLDEQQKRFEQAEPDEWRRLFFAAVVAWRDEWKTAVTTVAGETAALRLGLAALEKLPVQPTLVQCAQAFQAVAEADADDNWPRGTKGKYRDPLKAFFDEAQFLGSLAPGDDGNDPLAQDWEWARHQMLALVSLVREFTAEFTARKRELGGVDFADLEQCALRLLADSNVASVWRERLEHVFVDEYQDINAAQDAILTALSRDSFGVPPSGGQGAEPPEGGTPNLGNRFLVGDVKQSIYRFRLANPKIFQRYKSEWSGEVGRVTPCAPPAGASNPGAHGVTRPTQPTIEGKDVAKSATTRDGQAISLTENFRSREALLNFVNPLFAALMREEVGGVAYEPLEFGARGSREQFAAKNTDAPSAEFHLIARADEEIAGDSDDAPEVADEKNETPDLLAVEREARLIARRLRELKDGGHEIWDKEQRCFRPVQWSDMAVLLRSPSGRAEAFAMEFSRAGAPLSAARDGFFTSLEVSDLLNLLKLLDNPLQDVPLLAVLRSPLVGMSPDELAEVRAGSAAKPFFTALMKWREDVLRVACSVKQQGEPSEILDATRNTQHAPGETADGQSPTAPVLLKVKVFLEQFARWRELIRLTSISECLEAVLVETHYEALLLAGARGAERVANVRRLLDLARQFDPYQRQGLYRFLRFVQLQEDEDLDLQPSSPPTENAVRLISVHKSKGLEFPVVALAGLGTKFNERDLSEPVLLDEAMGLCPKITPPDAEQNYPGLTHWLARRAEKRELRGEELRLFYVALTRARDTLILVGTVNRKVDAVKWKSEPPGPIGTDAVADARSHLDWLLTWLPRATVDENWSGDRSGLNHLLCWQIYDENDPAFADNAPSSTKPGNDMSDGEPPAGAVEKLRAALEWKYPFAAATTGAAKTSVSAIRRRAADETDDEALKLFQARRLARTPAPASVKPGKLSAAEIGTAHHLFLQLLELERAGSEAQLRAEAELLRQAGLLAVEQAGALDFAALAAFWKSDVGARIRERAGDVKRELPFTARFAAREVESLIRAEAVLGAPNATDDFVVVQGVADLVVLLDKEIWLLDFKTDDVRAGELAAKSKLYEPQLKLYALALSRIYARPVTGCWLHFLSCGETVGVKM